MNLNEIFGHVILTGFISVLVVVILSGGNAMPIHILNVFFIGCILRMFVIIVSGDYKDVKLGEKE